MGYNKHNLINGPIRSSHNHDQLLSLQFVFWIVQTVPRSANHVVHNIVHWTADCNYFDNIPPFVLEDNPQESHVASVPLLCLNKLYFSQQK